MAQLVRRYRSGETGSALTEYALIIAAVAVGLFAVLGGFRDKIGGVTKRTAVTISQRSGGGYGSPGRPMPPPPAAPTTPVVPEEPDSASADDPPVAAASRAAADGY